MAGKLDVSVRQFPLVQGFEIEDHLGDGGMGVVYRARDQRTNEVVALKILSKSDAAGIYRFKREFRTLADIRHANLVRLFDLHCGEGSWFFTMEHVSGQHFFDFLGLTGQARGNLSTPTELLLDRLDAGADAVSSGVRASVSRPDPPGLARLCEAFTQLVQGLAALHEAGKLHCDIKPSNLLVESTGRVIVLDFGVSRAVAENDPFRTLDELAGTPEYMSPEQASGAELTPASDWYSVGVVLYEALSGCLPFTGPKLSVMKAKQLAPPARRPSELEPDVPSDLDSLCMDLLELEPAKRPGLAEITRRLGSRPEPSSSPEAEARLPLRTTFVGRVSELAWLQSTTRERSASTPVVVLLTGDSGIGKSALLEHFLGEESSVPDTLLLRGRCYQRESVPYKALDPIVDELARFLRRSSDRQVAELLPRHVQALNRVFPVLSRVRAIAAAAGPVSDRADLAEVRHRASGALKELLVRLADTRRVLLTIDDVQWGDVDSARMLLDILERPEPPPLCVVLSARSEQSGPMLQELLAPQNASTLDGLLHHLHLDELSGEEAGTLARRLLGASISDALTSSIARESGGHPLFVRELSLHLRRSGAPLERAGQTPPRLEPVLGARIAALPVAQRHALELIAVASHPVSETTLRQLNIDAAACAGLRDAQLARVSAGDTEASVECYHDRVRDVVVAGLTTERLGACHGQLAAALAQSSAADAEVLLEHYLAAGQMEQAREHVVASAQTAAQALAFARAAGLYRMALEIVPPSAWAEAQLQRRLAEVLAHDGRLFEAAQQYELAAADAASGSEQAVELRRLAAQHYLTAGKTGEGIPLLARVLRDVGLEYPRTPAAAIFRLAIERAKIRLFGLRFKERAAADVPAPELARIDACFSAAIGMALTDPIRTAAFSAQHLRLTLLSGEPMRVARGLAFEMGIAPGAGAEGLRWANQALPAAERLSARQGNAYHHGLFFLAQGHVAYLSGQWRGAVDWLSRAEASLREAQTADVHWALLSSTVLRTIAAVVTGDLKGVAARLPALTKEARRRSDLYSLALTSYPSVIIALAEDDPDAAARRLAELELRAERHDLRSFTALHCNLILDRYRGDEPGAWARLEREWPGLESSKLLLVNIIRVSAVAERCSAALGMLARGELAPYSSVARRCIRQLMKEVLPHARALALLLRARLALIQGQREAALALLTDGCLQLEAAGLTLQAQCARRSMGTLMGGNMGRILVTEMDATLRAVGIHAPARFAAMMAPGFDTAVEPG